MHLWELTAEEAAEIMRHQEIRDSLLSELRALQTRERGYAQLLHKRIPDLPPNFLAVPSLRIVGDRESIEEWQKLSEGKP